MGEGYRFFQCQHPGWSRRADAWKYRCACRPGRPAGPLFRVGPDGNLRRNFFCAYSTRPRPSAALSAFALLTPISLSWPFFKNRVAVGVQFWRRFNRRAAERHVNRLAVVPHECHADACQREWSQYLKSPLRAAPPWRNRSNRLFHWRQKSGSRRPSGPGLGPRQKSVIPESSAPTSPKKLSRHWRTRATGVAQVSTCCIADFQIAGASQVRGVRGFGSPRYS